MSEVFSLYAPSMKKQEGRREVVALGKHLCGAATDLTLRALATSCLTCDTPSSAAPHNPSLHSLKSIGIALCCHHACNWRDYVGKDWWRKVFCGSASEFEVCRYLSSWALLEEHRAGSLPSPTAQTLPPLPPSPTEPLNPSSTFFTPLLWSAALSTPLKACIGRAAKRAIDAGRLEYLSTSLPYGKGKLLAYCGARVSLENILLLWQRN